LDLFLIYSSICAHFIPNIPQFYHVKTYAVDLKSLAKMPQELMIIVIPVNNTIPSYLRMAYEAVCSLDTKSIELIGPAMTLPMPLT
jgi:hypothetical protein